VGGAKPTFQVHPRVVIVGKGIGRANYTGKAGLIFAILVADRTGGRTKRKADLAADLYRKPKS
jgi:hypothetical protein